MAKIITQEYVLSTREDASLTRQRQALDSFEFSLGCAIQTSHLYGGDAKALNYLPIRTLYPEHNEISHPILLARQVSYGSEEKRMRKEGNLRRIYHLGRSTISLRCIPDFEKQLDELQFIFQGTSNRDIKPAVCAIEGLVSETNKLNSNILEWHRDNE